MGDGQRAHWGNCHPTPPSPHVHTSGGGGGWQHPAVAPPPPQLPYVFVCGEHVCAVGCLKKRTSKKLWQCRPPDPNTHECIDTQVLKNIALPPLSAAPTTCSWFLPYVFVCGEHACAVSSLKKCMHEKLCQCRPTRPNTHEWHTPSLWGGWDQHPQPLMWAAFPASPLCFRVWGTRLCRRLLKNMHDEKVVPAPPPPPRDTHIHTVCASPNPFPPHL